MEHKADEIVQRAARKRKLEELLKESKQQIGHDAALQFGDAEVLGAEVLDKLVRHAAKKRLADKRGELISKSEQQLEHGQALLNAAELKGKVLAKTCKKLIALVMKHQSAVVNDCAFWPLIEQLHSGRQVYNQLKSSARAYLSVSAIFDLAASCPVAGQPVVVEA